MGFYAPAQIVRDARAHGVQVWPVCVNASYWDNVMEPDGTGGLAIRLGFRQVKSMPEDEVAWLTSARGNGYTDVDAVWRKAGISPKMIQALAEADAFHSLGLPRRAALWAAKAITADRPFSIPRLAKTLRESVNSISMLNSRPLFMPSAAFCVRYEKVFGSLGST